jgi:osmotically-inducible protein OsmY
MATATKIDAEILRDVLAELDWDPEVAAVEFNAAVDDGVVTLTGIVESYAGKVAAERAALRVEGVRAVANDLAVVIVDAPADTRLAKAVADALAANGRVPGGRVDISVSDGIVTLEGEVDWDYQRAAAVDTVRDVVGVRGIIERITVRQPHVSAFEIKAGIEQAFVRSAEIDADRIEVHVKDGQVVLTGTVRTWTEKQEAREAARRAKGVTEVTDLIEVERMWG